MSDDKTDKEAQPSVTTNISESNETRPALLPSGDENTQKIDTISVLIPGKDTPILFNKPPRVLLGRKSADGGPEPDVDLGPYHANIMGVSRRHAELVLQNGQCFVRDLSSSNGTWLNETKLAAGSLYPVVTGDQVRLGQLMLLVYLSLSDEEMQRTDELYEVCAVRVVDTVGGMKQYDAGLPVTYITNTIGQYLQAVTDIHSTIRRLNQQQPRPMMLREMRFDHQTHSLQLRVINATRLMTFLAEKLPVYLESARLNQTTTNEALARTAANYLLETIGFREAGEKRVELVARLTIYLKTVLDSKLRIIAVV